MTTFDRDWNTPYEGEPADNENINLGASRIRDLKVDVRQRMQVDHVFGDNYLAEANDGKHLKVTLVDNGTPTLDVGNGALYGLTTSGILELFYADSSGNFIQLTSAGAIYVQNLASLTVSGDITCAGNMFLTSGGIHEINGDTNFALTTNSGNNAIFFNALTYIQYNIGAARFEFVVGGVLVGHFP